MENINANQVKELENRKTELLETLHQLADSIITERDNLADRIFETEAEIAKYGKVRMGVSIEEDIFDVEAILAGGATMTKEDLQKRLSLFARAYVTNPFCDKKKAAAVYEILEELERVAGKLDDYYNAEVLKAVTDFNAAKKAYQIAAEARKDHQRETNGAVTEIRRAASHDVIGNGHLAKLGVYMDDFKFYVGPGVGYDGHTIVASARRLVTSAIEKAERLRIRNAAVLPDIPFKDGEYIPGGTAAVFSPKSGGSGLKEFAASFFKKK